MAHTMDDALEFLERGEELVPLDERRIPLIKWMHRPQSRGATVGQLERWSNAAHGWARIIPEGQCVLVDGPIDGETQGELPTTFTIPAAAHTFGLRQLRCRSIALACLSAGGSAISCRQESWSS